MVLKKRGEYIWYWLSGEEITEGVYIHNNWEEENGNGESFLQITNGNIFMGISDTYLRGFICEWEPVSSDFAGHSEEYRRYIEGLGEESEYGGEPEPIDFSHLADNPPEGGAPDNLPAKYDPRALGQLPPVRDQGTYATCWAFASLGALEASYIKQGFGTAADLSELHMAWFVYKDPRPSYHEKINDPNKLIVNQRGSNTKAIAFLSRIGTASETDMPYTMAASIENNPPSKLPENYTHPIRLKEAYQLGPVTSANRDEIKGLIWDYGAVCIAYQHSREGLSGSSYYFKTTQDYGHMVNVVGWDDNYSASNFKDNPGRNGAWLVKNSYGTSFGEGGYFWMSYEQKIGSSAVYIAANNNVSKLYGHDAVAAIDSIPYHWSASIFMADTAESLTEVAFHTRDNNVDYEIYVNKLGKDNPENPGTPSGEPVVSGKMLYTGYHTVTLRTPIAIEAGEYFSVIVKLGTNAYQYASAVEDTGGFRAAGTPTAAGKSYFAKSDAAPVSGDWTDGMRVKDANGNEKSCNACIKIFSASSGPSPNTPNNSNNSNKPSDSNDPSNTDNPGNKDNQDNDQNEPSDTDNQDGPSNPVTSHDQNITDERGTSGSSGGGGGCEASSIPAILGALALAIAFTRKK